MDRRDFLKWAAVSSAWVMLPWQVTRAALCQLDSGPATHVALAGVKRFSGDRLLVEAIKNTARAATDFS